MAENTYIKDLLVQKLTEAKSAVDLCDAERVSLDLLLQSNKERYNKLVADKDAIVAQLKSIDPTGVYE